MLRNANLISMTKNMPNNDKNMDTKIVAVRFEKNVGATEVSCEKTWKNSGYFSNQKSDYNMETVSYPKNTVYCLNQAYLTGLFHNLYILVQIIEASNPPEKIHMYVCKHRELRMIKPKYNSSTAEFLGLYETVRSIVVRGDPN